MTSPSAWLVVSNVSNKFCRLCRQGLVNVTNKFYLEQNVAAPAIMLKLWQTSLCHNPKSIPVQGMKPQGRITCIALLSPNSALDGVQRSTSRTGRFTSEERTRGTQWIEGWVGPRSGLYTSEKRSNSCHCREYLDKLFLLTSLQTVVWNVLLHCNRNFSIANYSLYFVSFIKLFCCWREDLKYKTLKKIQKH
jgi:hypothetical protein